MSFSAEDSFEAFDVYPLNVPLIKGVIVVRLKDGPYRYIIERADVVDKV